MRCTALKESTLEGGLMHCARDRPAEASCIYVRDDNAESSAGERESERERASDMNDRENDSTIAHGQYVEQLHIRSEESSADRPHVQDKT